MLKLVEYSRDEESWSHVPEDSNLSLKEAIQLIVDLLNGCDSLDKLQISSFENMTLSNPDELDDLALKASVLLAMFLCVKTTVQLFSSSLFVQSLKDKLKSGIPPDGNVNGNGDIFKLIFNLRNTAEIFRLPQFHAVKVVGLHSIAYGCILMARKFFNNIVAYFHHNENDNDNEEEIKEIKKEMLIVYEFLKSPALFLSNSQEMQPVYGGNIRMHQKNTFVCSSSFGKIQMGAPPETIKAYLGTKEKVPQIYVLPSTLFVGEVNYCELEFPIFFHHFVSSGINGKVIIIGSKEQMTRIHTILTESVFGPCQENMFLDEEIVSPTYEVNLIAEREAIIHDDIVNDDGFDSSGDPLLRFCNLFCFDENDCCEIDVMKSEGEKQGEMGKLMIGKEGGLFKFYEDGDLIAFVDVDFAQMFPSPPCPGVTLPDSYSEKVDNSAAFISPTLGLTFLGTSHGFDPCGRTTGFIIWINGNGIMVDPPYDTVDYLARNRINPRIVNRVILTHCHSDHDSGLLRSILHGEKITLYTTKTIMESYKRKAMAIIGHDPSQYFHFNHVEIGDSCNIGGALFEFDYSFHTIPTLRFRLEYKSHTISYSADTKFDKNMWKSMVESGTMTPSRAHSLANFLFESDIIIHEMGIPPIHTSVDSLNVLPDDIKKKMLIVHSASIPEYYFVESSDEGKKERKKIPVEYLRAPESGLSHTISVKVSNYVEGFGRATSRLQLLTHSLYFRDLSPPQIFQIFGHLQELFAEAGSVIVKSGDEGNAFFFVESGLVEIYDESNKSLARILSGDVFGENALWGQGCRMRSASVRALTDTHLLVLSTKDFRSIAGINVDHELNNVSKYRNFLSKALGRSTIFKGLTKEQIELISSNIDEELRFNNGEYIIRQGDIDSSMFLIREGSVFLERTSQSKKKRFKDNRKDSRRFKILHQGESFGEISMITGLPRTASVIAREFTIVLRLKRSTLDQIINKFQNIRFVLGRIVEDRLNDASRIDSL